MILTHIYDVDISQPLLPTVLQPMMVTGDKLANRIGVRLKNGAQPYTPDGSCRGYVLRADGATVPILDGVVNGNEMYIDLPEAAYAVQGSVVISIVCVTSTAITTVFLGSGTVNRSQTDVVIDPGTVIDDISTLIQAIETAVASIPEDYSTLSSMVDALTHVDLSISGKYIASTGVETANSDYSCTDYIPVNSDSVLILDGFWTGTGAYAYMFYTAATEKISGANSITSRTVVTTIPSTAAYVRFSSRTSQGETPVAYVSNHVVENMLALSGRVDAAQELAANAMQGTAPVFAPTAAYSAGDHVWYLGVLYRFTADHAAGAWTGTDAEEVKIGAEVADLKSAVGAMNTATASDEGKALKAKTVTDGKVTEWEFGEAGGGEVTPDQISMSAVTEQTSLTPSFTDGEYSTGYYNISSGANFSLQETEIPTGSVSIEYTTYDGSGNATKAQFLLRNGNVEVVTPSYSKVATRLYICTCSIPEGAVSFRSSIYTSEKSNAYIKVFSHIKYIPSWIGLPNNSVDAASVNSDAAGTKTALTVSYDDGYYCMYVGTPTDITQFIEHETNASQSIAVLSGIVPLRLYEIDSYYSPAVSAGGIVVWYDENGNRIVDDQGKPYNYVLESNNVKKNENHYRQIVMAPLKAATGKITIKLANKADCIFNLVTPTTKQLEWLSVNIRNLNDECINILTQIVMNNVHAEKYAYGSVVNRSISVMNKTVVLFGDSIAAGVSSGTIDSNFKSWANIVKDRMGLTLNNQAVSATTITNTDSSATAISAKVLAYTGSAKIAIIAGGTNDHTLSKPLGEWGDTAVTTFYGALYAMCEYLKTLSLDKVVFITPINKSQRYSNPVSLDKYREAIQITARKYGFDVLEGRGFGFPTEGGVMQTLFLPDNLHPSQAGHVMYANEVCTWLA